MPNAENQGLISNDYPVSPLNDNQKLQLTFFTDLPTYDFCADAISGVPLVIQVIWILLNPAPLLITAEMSKSRKSKRAAKSNRC